MSLELIEVCSRSSHTVFAHLGLMHQLNFDVSIGRRRPGLRLKRQCSGRPKINIAETCLSKAEQNQSIKHTIFPASQYIVCVALQSLILRCILKGWHVSSIFSLFPRHFYSLTRTESHFKITPEVVTRPINFSYNDFLRVYSLLQLHIFT